MTSLQVILPINTICVTCLSQNRKLHSPSEFLQFLILLDIKLSPMDKICWECKSFMSKMVSFKMKAQTAQGKLSNLAAISILEMKSLSNLNYSITEYNNITGNDNLEVKKELDLSYESTNDYEYPIKFESWDEVHSEPDTKEVLGDVNMEVCDEMDTVSDAGVTGNFDTIDIGKAEVMRHNINPAVSDTAMISSGVEDLQKIVNSIEAQMPSSSTEATSADLEKSNAYTVKKIRRKDMLVRRQEKINSEEFKNSIFKCIECLEVFPSVELLVEHRQKHTSSGLYACNVCEQRFECLEMLSAHVRTHYTVYKCGACACTTDKVEDMRAHCREEHNSADGKAQKLPKPVVDNLTYPVVSWRPWSSKQATCDLCQEVLPSLVMFRIHMGRHNRELVNCEECGKKMMRGTLKKHMHCHAPGSKQQCPNCSRTYNREGDLKKHLVSCDPMAMDRYCVECDFQFKSKAIYNSHRKIKHYAPEDKKHKCTGCDKLFPTASSRNSHFKATHNEGISYACKICNLTYKSHKLLSAHVSSVHDQKKPVKDKVCDICGKTYQSKMMLAEHMNTHSGARPHSCNQCGDTFAYSSALYTHTKLKHKKKLKVKNGVNVTPV